MVTKAEAPQKPGRKAEPPLISATAPPSSSSGRKDVPLALTTAERVFEVVDGVPALVGGKLGQEGVVVGDVADFIDNDVLVVRAQLVDDVFGLLAKLELFERGYTFAGETDSVLRHRWSAAIQGRELMALKTFEENNGGDAYPERDYKVISVSLPSSPKE
jgi:hypothetical protein